MRENWGKTRQKPASPPVQVSLTTQTGLELKLENDILSVRSAGFEQSIVHVNDLQFLEFEYLQQMTLVLDCLFPLPRPIRVFHAGCGAGALAGAWATSRPGSRQVAVDIDSELVAFARKHAGLPPKPAVSFRPGDARTILTESLSSSGKPVQFDVIVRDAFADELVPHLLQTVQWNQLVQTHLVPGAQLTATHCRSENEQLVNSQPVNDQLVKETPLLGVSESASPVPSSSGWYFANVAHSPSKPARAEIASMSEVFSTVFLVAEPKVLKSARKGNVVAMASSNPVESVDFDEIDRALRSLSLPTRLVRPSELPKWLAGAKPLFD